MCWLNRHTPNRDHAKWDGTHFTSTCIHCSAPIRRRKKQVWMKDWLLETGHAPTAK